ncbi:hypothetical protein L211DRAFT_284366 [Terfezia boudieri ATCC MYA-4762]|uniref:DRBM domain-containing protein n=1 Tax=Terfezia boudieri ATCC MYA-4762 TaxID=1051890 RepID=A0A3N4LK92_9PEZI|nr:hypothetical protein L211DRAFT_284366 [Terfezia boudieri ATCC MYA-4762]
MFYINYLASLCKRRHWPDPHYECYPYNGGFTCNVRVNHRDYQSVAISATQDLAREAAAQRAYLVCSNISVNESLYQGQGAGNGASVQPPHLLPIGSVSMAMAQPRYVPPTGGIVPVQNGLPKPEQGPISSNGRMSNGQGVVIVGHPQLGM